MSTETLNPTAERWQVSREAYHADRECLSNSALGDFIRSPKLYYGRHVLKCYPREESTAFDIGTIVHHLVLEPHKDAPFAVIPSEVLTSNGQRRGAKWEAFEAANPGKILMKSHEIEPIEEMLKSLRQHPRAKALLFGDGGERELAIRWECERHGIMRRSLVDLLRPNVIVDLKTSGDASPEAFAASAWRHGYARQAAFYKDAVHSITGEYPPMVFVVVEKTPPYSCECYELDGEFEEIHGYDRINSAMERLKKCRETGEWESPTHGQIVTISAPRFAKYADEYSFQE